MTYLHRWPPPLFALVGLLALASSPMACSSGDTGGDEWDFGGYIRQDICVGPSCYDGAGDDIGVKPRDGEGDRSQWPEVYTDGDLHFVQEQGDDGQSCVGKATCTLIFEGPDIRDIKVRFTEDGSPSEGALIRYRIFEDSLNQSELDPGSGLASTNAEGVVGVIRLKLGFPTPLNPNPVLTEDEFRVEVSVNNRPDAGVITFIIKVNPKPLPPLIVFPDYLGFQPVESATVWLFKQTPDPMNPGQYQSLDAQGRDISCRTLMGFVRRNEPGLLPSSMLSSGEVEIGRSVHFQEDVFDAVAENEHEQMYTVLATGVDASRTTRVVGCDDLTGLVKTHQPAPYSRQVYILLSDLWPRLSGTYTVTSTFDLVSGLPSNIAQVVYFIVDFFENPAEAILRLLCDLQSGITDSMCDWVFDEDPSGDLRLTFGGGIVVEIINAIVYGLGQGNAWGQILVGGYDVGQLLTNLRMESRLTLNAEPDYETGELPGGSTSEFWDKVLYRWTLEMDPACQADPDCGWEDISFNAIAQEAVTGTFTGRVNTVEFNGNPAGTLLTIDPHSLNIKYGQLVNHLFLKVILPRLAGGIPPDGLPVVDTWEKLFKTLLAGRQCLADEIDGNPNTPTCCEAFVDSVLNEAGNTSWLENILDTGCTMIVEFGALYIEALLTDQDLETGDSFVIGTAPGDPCRMYDHDDDLVVDSLGDPSDERRYCLWQADIGFIGFTVSIDATFYGVRW